MVPGEVPEKSAPPTSMRNQPQPLGYSLVSGDPSTLPLLFVYKTFRLPAAAALCLENIQERSPRLVVAKRSNTLLIYS